MLANQAYLLGTPGALARTQLVPVLVPVSATALAINRVRFETFIRWSFREFMDIVGRRKAPASRLLLLSMRDVTRILRSISDGDPQAAEELLPVVYAELRRLAACKMAHEAPGQTLQPTALVHEAWLRLAGTKQEWRDQRHFVGAAAEAMRRILIDRARKRNRSRHGHGLERIDLSRVDIAADTDDQTLLALDEALSQLALESPERAELVKLRYFIGLSIPDAAAALGISESTAKRQWNYIRAWLFRRLSDAEEHP